MTYLSKLQLEQNTTEPAQSSCSSDTISKSDGAPAKQLYELLHNGKVIFHGYKDTKTANIVHGHAVSNSELKFAIVKVVSSDPESDYPNFDKDRHCESSFIAWPKKDNRFHRIGKWVSQTNHAETNIQSSIQAGSSGACGHKEKVQ